MLRLWEVREATSCERAGRLTPVPTARDIVIEELMIDWAGLKEVIKNSLIEFLCYILQSSSQNPQDNSRGDR